MSRKSKQQNKEQKNLPSQEVTLKEYFKSLPSKKKQTISERTQDIVEYIQDQNLNPKYFEIQKCEQGFDVRMEIKEIGKQRMACTFSELLVQINSKLDQNVIILNLNANDLVAKLDINLLQDLKVFQKTLKQFTFSMSKHSSLQSKSNGKKIGSFMDIICKLDLLEKLHLNLSHNFIGSYLSDILKKISKLKKLNNLSLNFNNCEVSESDLEDFSKNLQQFTNLNKLSLMFMKNNLPNPSQLFFCIAQMNNIKELELDLRHNEIESQSVQQLCFSIEQFSFLYKLHLNLSNNKVYKEGAKYLGMSIKKLDKLVDLLLSLQWDNIQDLGSDWLGQEISQMDNLIKLRLELWQIIQQFFKTKVILIILIKRFDKIKTPEIICNHLMQMNNLIQVNTFLTSYENMPLNYTIFEELINQKASLFHSIIGYYKLISNKMTYNPNYVFWDLYID
ncbi:hypothetical protein TTHERM_000008779 (macronuclear) [Tetrahymena thermophila SB210]|uniref:Kinase domain protein n=1 Tax=Tetrahymena thermophila (strain SB210) TaxID=312017 RepID=W7XK98_TETTS|nr:hypothetical protein TTHERM_000008779 [Tetrahymena thermophila SB210]EWS76316.1 hypothetical protein TTHERM_000008779 [Tetrahymena thermophila SB210]|eukprot:XP_012651100.1 hypothetical protein TTHERM_000008779 [Tetrahymena thermophila SB210]